MSANVLARAARESLRLLAWQVACVICLALLVALIVDVRAGWSALAGGGIGLIWTIYMAFALFRHSTDHGVRLSAGRLFAGWLIKVVLTICLLIIAFRSKAIAPLPLLGGMFGALVAYWVWNSFRVMGDAHGK